MAKALQAIDQLTRETPHISTVEMVGAQVGVHRPLFQHMVDDTQQAVRQSDQGSLAATTRRQATILSGEVSSSSYG